MTDFVNFIYGQVWVRFSQLKVLGDVHDRDPSFCVTVRP